MALGKFALTGLALGTAYVVLPTGYSGSSQTFAQPAAIAIERIEAKRRVVNGTGLGSLTIESAGTDQSALLIGVTKAGDPHSAKCRVTISAVSARESRADLDCTQTNVQDKTARRVGAEALGLIVGEHLAATVENRPYNIDRVADSMIALVAINGPMIAASMASSRK
jgi:hypothetical protein